MSTKTAFDYHNELKNLTTYINSIEGTLCYIEDSFNLLEKEIDSSPYNFKDEPTLLWRTLAMANSDLKKTHTFLRKRLDFIENKLSSYKL